jgi:hypothetical protein
MICLRSVRELCGELSYALFVWLESRLAPLVADQTTSET